MSRTKTRIHNEWFQPVSLGNRKSCPNCGAKLLLGESLWSWGEYVQGKFLSITHFCKHCYAASVKSRLEGHTSMCGCMVELVGKGCTLPNWLTLD